METIGNLEPYSCTSGPRNAKIIICGESWGEQEEITQSPFMGYSGQELTRMLGEADIRRKDCLLTNVLPIRPPNNNLDALCGSRAEVGKEYPYPQLKQGKYLLPRFLPHLARLRSEISGTKPNLVLALGNLACWALLGSAGITSRRGTVASCQLAPAHKVLPTFHPAYVLRDWSKRVIVIADMLKAAREAEFPEIRRPQREVLVSPTLAEIHEWTTRPAELYAADIETSLRQITMFGFARSASDALVIPFYDPTKPGNSYWSTLADEADARQFVQILLGSSIPKVFQNGLYDLQYALREGYRPANCLHDTMLLHHAMFPELQKGLGFMGSIYTNEASWKLMRHEDSYKKDA